MKNKTALIGIITFVYYFIYSTLNTLPVYLVGINYNELDQTVKIIYQIIVELIFVVTLFYVNKDLINQAKDFFKGYKTLIKKYIRLWPMAFGLMIMCNIFIVLFLPENSPNNQEAINELVKTAPVYIVIAAVIYAPIVEEIVFRLAFRKIFKNDILFIVLSGLTFGAFHVVGSLDSLLDLVFIIPYSIPGFVFAYALIKSKNIFVPVSLHFLHNSFTMILQFILLSFL